MKEPMTCHIVPVEDDYLSVSELPYVEGMIARPFSECYACCSVGLEVVGTMDGVEVLQCNQCGAHSRAIEKVRRWERACTLRSMVLGEREVVR
jgi:hypothetical protein